MIRVLAPLVLFCSLPATAAERSVGVGSFERVRVQGAFDVTIAPGPPRAIVSGTADALERVAVSIDNTTLTIRAAAGARGGPAPRIRLTTPRVSGILVLAGGRVTAARMAGERVDLSVTGNGEIAVDAVAAREVVVLLIGTGAIRVAGEAARVRLASNGTGRIDAAALRAGDLTVRLEGSGAILANARFNAAVTTTGLGSVDVDGNAKCTVRAGGGPVRCGIDARR